MINVVSVLIFVAFAAAGGAATWALASPVPVVVAAIIGLLAAQSPQIAQQWVERTPL